MRWFGSRVPIYNRSLNGKLIFKILKKGKFVDLVLAEHLSLYSYFLQKKIMTLHCPNGVSPEYYGQGLMTKREIQI